MRRECPLERLYFAECGHRELLEKGVLDFKMLGRKFPGRGTRKCEGLHQKYLGIFRTVREQCTRACH